VGTEHKNNSIGNILRQRQQQRRRSELNTDDPDYESLAEIELPEDAGDAPEPINVAGNEVSAILGEIGVVANGFVVNHIVEVTPEIAEAWLEINKGNRNIALYSPA